MYRRALLIVGIIVILALVISGVLLRAADQKWKGALAVSEQLDNLRDKNSDLRDSLRLLVLLAEDALENASITMQHVSEARQAQRMLLNQYDVSDLKKKGLRNPVDDLRRDLMSHPELIPVPGVHGGTMGFVKDSITLLSQRWVFAECEDGHIMARCLLSYEIAPDGSIVWHIMSTASE